MKAWLVNPFDQTVTEVEHTGDYRDIYRLIEAQPFDTVRINNHGDVLYVDDEGLFVPQDKQRFFKFNIYPQPLAGRALCLSTNDKGDSTAPLIALEDLRKMIEWMPEGFTFTPPAPVVISW